MMNGLAEAHRAERVAGAGGPCTRCPGRRPRHSRRCSRAPCCHSGPARRCPSSDGRRRGANVPCWWTASAPRRGGSRTSARPHSGRASTDWFVTSASYRRSCDRRAARSGAADTTGCRETGVGSSSPGCGRQSRPVGLHLKIESNPTTGNCASERRARPSGCVLHHHQEVEDVQGVERRRRYGSAVVLRAHDRRGGYLRGVLG